MDNSQASQNLQVIRTLMERAAVYRRALAPVMILAGTIGLVGAALPCFITIASPRSFSLFWMLVGLLALLASLLLVRKQALKAKEPFWSPPTRRVTQALAPAFFAGMAGGSLWSVLDAQVPGPSGILVAAWMIFYGCGLHAAGFFMARGIKLFGWIFVLSGSALFLATSSMPELQKPPAAHGAMGIYFGLLHVAYGVYLYFTEKTRNPL